MTNRFLHFNFSQLATLLRRPTCDDDSGSVADLALTVASDARVVTDIFMPYVGNPEFGAVVENANSGRRLHWVGILVPVTPNTTPQTLLYHRTICILRGKLCLCIFHHSL
jgi:hypothetical protein